jgi:formylglycine-generating enzyme required for sulfatase activity
MIIFFFLLVSMPLGSAIDDDQQTARAVEKPGAASMDSARVEIRGVFEEEYAAFERYASDERKKEAGLRLAYRLLKEERKGGHSHAVRYVLFLEALSITADIADVQVLIQAVNGLAAHFGEDEVHLLEQFLDKASRKAKSADFLQMAHGFVHLAERALVADRYEAAGKAVQSAVRAARLAKDKDLERAARNRQDVIEDLKRQWKILEQYWQALQDDPQKPEANYLVGRFFAVRKGDWERALPHLSRGSSEDLKKLALLEMQKPASTNAMIELGDGWMQQAEGERDRRAKGRYHERATGWYKRAFPDLTGLDRARVEKRIAGIAEQASPAPQPGIDAHLLAALAGPWEIPSGFEYRGRETFSCGGRTNTLKTFRHDGTGLDFVLVPAGVLMRDEPAAGPEEEGGGRGYVSIRSFLLSRTPCTQAAWDRIGGTDMRQWKGPDLPVERVGWNDCTEWCRKAGLRLPSETEWEYACRAGTDTVYFFGNSDSDLDDHAWFSRNSDGRTHPVGAKPPNAFGLFDMGGNVWEWCEDGWHEHFSNAPADGSARRDSDPDKRVVRGGSWESSLQSCRSASRGGRRIGLHDNSQGFRPACSLE